MPAIDESVTTRPWRWVHIAGKTRRTHSNVPVRFTSSVRCHCSLSSSSSEHGTKMPAQVTSVAAGPSSASTSASPAATEVESPTSIATPNARGMSGASRSHAATRAPSARNVSATLRPMPRAAPVTTATRPSNPCSESWVQSWPAGGSVDTGGASASTAVATTAPTPGIVISLLAISSCLARLAISASRSFNLASSACKVSTKIARIARAASGRSHLESCISAMSLATCAGPWRVTVPYSAR